MVSHSSQSAGFTLLEILIAVALLSVGLLGFVKAEIIALHYNQDAYFQSVAQWQQNTLSERLRLCDFVADVHHCTSSQVGSWQVENALLLPQSKSELQAQGLDHQITIQWQPRVFVSNAQSTKLSPRSLSIYRRG